MPTPPTPPSRAGTVTITAHMPKETRDRLKIMAVRLGRTMNDLMAEALEDLFTKHESPEAQRQQKPPGQR
jgi:predicted transcriptional regulator